MNARTYGPSRPERRYRTPAPEYWASNVDYDGHDACMGPRGTPEPPQREGTIVVLRSRFKCPKCGCEYCETKLGFTECSWCHGYGRRLKH